MQPDFELNHIQDWRPVGVEAVGNLVDEQIEQGRRLYEDYRCIADKDLKLGLYGDDIKRALSDRGSVLIKYENKEDQPAYLPLLVPVNQLEWYNLEVLEQIYGKDARLLYYTHPPIPDDVSETLVKNILEDYLGQGAIIFTDRYIDDSDSASVLIDVGKNYNVRKLGTGETESGVEVFTGEVKNLDARGVFNAPTIHEVYQKLLVEGELDIDTHNGVALARTISGAEAERIWDIYQSPFDELGQNHPTYAGFDKEGLLNLLADPEVVKVVNRVEGSISTLCIFVQDFEHCPWFNEEHFKKEYPEYHSTKNILIFPGIVTDPGMKGQRYSFAVIDLANRLLAKRGSDFLITFECTETSATYIPQIVQGAIEASGYSEIHGLEAPTSRIDYIGVSKQN